MIQNPLTMKTFHLACLVCLLSAPCLLQAQEENMGYYRYPALHGKTIVFTAEGDLWKVSMEGGIAQRLTTHGGQETNASISPDGKFIAYTAHYDGPAEAYLIPVEGGLPKRLTFHGDGTRVTGWSPEGDVLYTTQHFSTLPNSQLVRIDPETLEETLVPLQQASEGAYSPDGQTLIFTRLAFQGSRTKRYAGGTAQNLWKFKKGSPEAVPLTADYPGTSKAPMWWEGRIYFASDRDGTMNIWSMTPEGADLRQETDYLYFDIQDPKLHDGNIIYQIGADLGIYNIASQTEGRITIYLASDFEQRREKWVTNPSRAITSAGLSGEGDYLTLTSRGRVFVAPVKTGRFVEVTRKYGIRYRNAGFLPGSEDVIMQSDESGEVEYWKAPMNGMGNPEQLSSGSTILMNPGQPSPDGKYIAWSDKNLVFWLLDVKNKSRRTLDTGHVDGIGAFSWSPDSKWIAYEITDKNQNIRIKIQNIQTGKSKIITTDRLDSRRPVWDPEGKWLYFTSQREFIPQTGVWGPRQPEPYYDRMTKIYMLALQKEHKWPFLEKNELMEDEKDNGEKKEDESGKKKKDKKDKKEEDKVKEVKIDLGGLETRLYEVPLKAGNYFSIALTKTHLYYSDYVRGADKSETILKSLKITNEDPKPKEVLSGIRGFELSGNGKKIGVRKGNDYYVFEANGNAPGKLEESKVKLDGWSFLVDPVEEWKQIFTDAWRTERDYFYDPDLHGVDWKAVYERHLPLVDRVTEREELNNLISQVLGELSALHIFVGGGDVRRGSDNAYPSCLGARLVKEEGGYRIKHIYLSDPDYPGDLSPLARPHSKIREGDLITRINGIPVLEAGHISALLRRLNQKQVRLTLKDSGGKTYEEIVKPISTYQERNLRYREWEYTRRQTVEEKSGGTIGYLHLRAMGSYNFTEFIKGFYPVFNRPGLIIDVRHNSGGNIDAWILEKLMRKAWMYWAPRAGQPYWNMHYAFRGYMIVLINERTSSDGEAFAEGFRRLGLGELLGTRTWGGEIWLNSSVTRLVDQGNATAAMFGVYDDQGNWLIEGHGVDPDIEVDNLPHRTFLGKDAQLEAAIEYLQEKIEIDPRPVPPVPPHPDKSFEYKK